MAKRKSRVLNFREPYPAAVLVPTLIEALNGSSANWESHYSRDALMDLVRELQHLEHEWLKPANRFEKDRAGYGPSKAVKEHWRIVSSIIGGYTAYPALTLSWTSDEAEDLPDATWSLEWNRADGKPNLDLIFALNTLEIFKQGKISSVKQCEECGKWIIARFPHQRFCSGECKDRFHTTNEADKARRREWARENYQTRKALESGSRMSGKQHGGKK